MRARTPIAIVCTAAAGLLALPVAGVAATITVDDSGDAVADVGDCTLREALESANDNAPSGATAGECPAGEPGATARDVIRFALGVGDRVIQPATQLPVITDRVEIDGRNGTASARIELDGTGAPASSEGIFLTTGSDGSYVHQLAVYGFSEDGVVLFSNANVAERVITGTDLASSAGIGNDAHGIDVLGDDNLIDGVVASGNGTNGINVDFRADGTTIVSSKIGASRDGDAALANQNYGIDLGVSSLESSDATTVGGSTGLTPGGACSGDCNVISGNTFDGIHAQSAGAAISGLVIRGNHVGVTEDGSGALGNGSAGITLAGDIPAAAVRENVISANGDDGISISSVSNAGFDLAPRDVVIAGNRIGVDSAGTAVLGNGAYGIEAHSDVTSGFDPVNGLIIGGTEGLTPGGPCTGDCNVIGGAQINGISLSGPVVDAKVLGNHLGADAAGTSAVANTQSGLTLSGTTRAVVGSPAAPNVISGNGMVGLDLFGQSTANVVESNLIGVGADGISPLANGESGIRVFSVTSGTTIGGLTAAGNEIAHNTESGVEVVGGGSPESTSPILGNSIHSNGELGIDLRPDGITGGVTPNDGPGDADGGGNGSLNFPVLDTVAAVGATTLVRGSIATLPGRALRIELFASASADPSGHGEGETLLGAFEVTTNGDGTATFSELLEGAAATDKQFAATATLLGGSGPEATSEFSAAIGEGCDVTGTPGPDALSGGPADEVICGLAGDDLVAGGGGADLIVGGSGADVADYSKAAGPLDASLATGVATESGVTDELLETEAIVGSEFADRLTGGAGPDALDGLGGDDHLLGAAGDDALAGGAGDDELAGDEGVDTVDGGGGSDDLEGGSDADLVKGGGGAKDAVSGQGGGDSLKGGGGKKDDVRGGGGKDKLDGGGGAKDSCNGGSGKDRKSAPGCETKKSLG
jgi:hypothetical protein